MKLEWDGTEAIGTIQTVRLICAFSLPYAFMSAYVGRPWAFRRRKGLLPKRSSILVGTAGKSDARARGGVYASICARQELQDSAL